MPAARGNWTVDDKLSLLQSLLPEVLAKRNARTPVRVGQRRPRQADAASRERALELKPEADALFRDEQWRAACEVYSRMIDLDPSNGTYFLNRSAVFLKLGKWQQAEQDASDAEFLLKTSNQRPLTFKAIYRAACAKIQQGRFEDALIDLQAANLLQPGNDLVQAQVDIAEERLREYRERFGNDKLREFHGRCDDYDSFGFSRYELDLLAACGAAPWWGVSRDLLALAEKQSGSKDFRERDYHEMQQCMNCFKSRSGDRNIKLQRCAKCMAAAYCSRECQKAHWPLHKPHCEANARLRNANFQRTISVRYGRVVDAPANAAELADKMQAWLARRRAFFYEFVASALRLQHNPRNILDQILDIRLEWVSEAPSLAKRFKVVTAEARNIMDFGIGLYQSIKSARETLDLQLKDHPVIGVAFIQYSVVNLEPQSPDLDPCVIRNDTLLIPEDPNWHDRLMAQVGAQVEELPLVD